MTLTEQITLSVFTFLFSVIIAIASGLVTAILTYRGYQKQAKAELEKEYHSRFNEKKWEVYLSYVKLMPTLREMFRLERKFHQNMLKKDSTFTEEDASKLLKLVDDNSDSLKIIENEILLIGSRDVITTWVKWKSLGRIYDVSEVDINAYNMRLLNFMREDLGLKSYLNENEFDESSISSSTLEKLLEYWENLKMKKKQR
jgi:hypothetical protein